MNHLRRAAYHNSNGALFLAVGENKKALKSFKTSLQTLARALLELEEGGMLGDAPPPPAVVQDAVAGAAGNNADQHHNNDMVLSRAIPRSALCGPTNVPTNPQDVAENEEGKPYIYSKGLVFYPRASVTILDFAFYSSIIVFNLVVAYHRQKTHLRERNLTKLLALYEIVLKLLGESSRSRHNDCTNLVVAALNNKSVIHSELGQHQSAQRMLYLVWDVMKYPERRPRLLETWEVEGFFLNIYTLLVYAPRVAGAA